MTKALITTNKETIKKMIFDGVEDKAVELCKEICKYDIYNGWAGFGLYISEARKDDPVQAKKLANKLTKILNGQKEETHHVWIALQDVMKFMAGQATEEFKQKVENND